MQHRPTLRPLFHLLTHHLPNGVRVITPQSLSSRILDAGKIFRVVLEAIEVHEPLDEQPLCERAARTVRRLHQISDCVPPHRHVLNQTKDASLVVNSCAPCACKVPAPANISMTT